MHSIRLLFLACVFLFSLPAFGNNVQISNVSFTPIGSGGQITFDITWENSWRLGVNSEFHDAVWVFVKYAPNGGPQWLHADIQVVSNGAGIQVLEPNDLKGAFILRGSQGEGNVPVSTVIFDVNNNVGIYPDFKVFGIEMVYTPQGPYYLGDGTSDGRFHKGSDTTQAFQVLHSGIIKIGTLSTQLSAKANIPGSDIPAEYPNGFDAFYCMKYSVSQEQYVEFLNTLDRGQQNNRTETDISGEIITNVFVMSNTTFPSVRNGIRCEEVLPLGSNVEFFCDLDGDGVGNEINDGQNIVMNYLNRNDLLAYLDWAALRPMTELEYEKICRGPLPPVGNEMAWGTSGFTILNGSNIINIGTSGETADIAGISPGLLSDNTVTTAILRTGFAATSSSSRTLSGATYYGVLDMSGNGHEVAVLAFSIGSLQYAGELGDGLLNASGNSDESAWVTLSYFYKGALSSNTNRAVSKRSSTGGVVALRGNTTSIRGVRQF